MRRRTLRHGNEGFTLLELLLVLILIGITMGLASQLVFLKPNMTAATFKEDVQSFLDKERTRSLGLSGPTKIFLSRENRQLVSSNGDPLLVPKAIEMRLHSEFEDAEYGAALLFLPNGECIDGVMELIGGDKRISFSTNPVIKYGS